MPDPCSKKAKGTGRMGGGRITVYFLGCFFEKGLDKQGALGYNNRASLANGARRVRRRMKRILQFGEVLKLAEEAPLLRV